jgi:hypothetical protein
MVTTSDDADDVDALAAVESLRAALTGAGTVRLCLAVDPATRSLALVDLDLDLDLGRVRAAVTLRLAHALHEGESAA